MFTMTIKYFVTILYEYLTYWAVFYILGFFMTNYYSKKIYGNSLNNISLCHIPENILWLIRPSFMWYFENARKKPSLRIGVIYQVLVFVISSGCLVLMIIFTNIKPMFVYAIFDFWKIMIAKVFFTSSMILLAFESLKLFYIAIHENILGRKREMKETKTWKVTIKDVAYNITFIKDYWWRGYRLDIDGEIMPLFNSPYENLTGMDIPIMIGNNEVRFYRSSRKSGGKMDLVVEGYFWESREKYAMSTKRPFLYTVFRNRWREKYGVLDVAKISKPSV